MTRFTILFALTLGCRPSPEPKTDPPPSSDVAVELAGVTLGDECGTGAKPPRPPTKLAQANEATAPAAREPAAAKIAASEAVAVPSAGACATPGCGGPSHYTPPCEQTSMQLSLRSSGQATTIKIKQVELLDASGKVVDVLTARAPSRWDDHGKYIAWNETIAANQDFATSYTLTSPNWDKIAKGRWNAHTMAFKLRVTVTIGSSDRTVEKQSLSPAMLEPAVAT